MLTLIQLYDVIKIYGIINPEKISKQFDTPMPMMTSMLEGLVRLNKIEDVVIDQECPSGNCKNCLIGKPCQTIGYRLKN